MASKVYTKKGDGGYTSVMGTREKLPKSHPRLEAIGTVDELNTHVGLLRSYAKELDRKNLSILSKPLGYRNSSNEHKHVDMGEVCGSTLERIQNTLFEIGGELAMVKENPHENNQDTFNSYEEEINQLESAMDSMSECLAPLKNFILPGGPVIVCQAHVARVVTRRAERDINKICFESNSQEDIINPSTIQYINRLSDYFFVLARMLCHRLNTSETIWKSKK